MIGFATKEKIKHSFFIVLLQGTNETGEEEYAYVMLQATESEKLAIAIKRGNIVPEDIGQVLLEGKGKPDMLTRWQMKKNYLFAHQKTHVRFFDKKL